MLGGKSVLICSIFACIEVNGRAPICRLRFVGDGCGDFNDWEDSLRRTTTPAPRTYFPSDFLASQDGSISCRAVADCPKLSKEQLLFKMQMAGSYAKSADECRVDCNNR